MARHKYMRLSYEWGALENRELAAPVRALEATRAQAADFNDALPPGRNWHAKHGRRQLDGRYSIAERIVPLSLLNPVLGLQADVFLTKQLTATATTSWERDRVTNYIYHQDNAVLAQKHPRIRCVA